MTKDKEPTKIDPDAALADIVLVKELNDSARVRLLHETSAARFRRDMVGILGVTLMGLAGIAATTWLVCQGHPWWAAVALFGALLAAPSWRR